MALLILFEYQWSFLLSSFLFGIAMGTRTVVFAPTVKKLSGLADSTSYFAVAPLLTTVFALSLPMTYGKFLDLSAGLNGDAYRILFFVSALLIMGTLYCLLRVDFNLK